MNGMSRKISRHIELSDEEEKKLDLEPVDDLFSELEEIGNELDKYNMDWAFDYSHGRIEGVFESEIKTKFHKLKNERIEEQSIAEETNSMLHKIAHSIAKTTRSFNRAQTINTIAEIIAAFVIIMLSHEITAYFVGHYATLISTTIIVAVFGIFKIFIEKRYMAKISMKRQKRIFKNSLQKTQKAFIQMFILYITINRFDEKYKDADAEERHIKAVEFIKINHPKLENI